MKKLYILMLTALLGSVVAETAESATDFSNLPAGIYLAKVSINGNHTIVRFKK